MKDNFSFKHRLDAFFFVAGASILLVRTIIMLSQNSMISMVGWVAALLFMEFLLDLGWLFSSILWWISNKRKWLKITLRLAATAIILHAIRVLIFILGRVGPWIDFDYRPEYRPLQYSDRTWIYFAAIMSILGVIGVIVVWIARRHLKTRKGSQ